MRPHGMLDGTCKHGRKQYCIECEVEGLRQEEQELTCTIYKRLLELDQLFDKLMEVQKNLIGHKEFPKQYFKLDMISRQMQGALQRLKRKTNFFNPDEGVKNERI